MKNYKKLLFAGLAIVPLALSSWSSTGNEPHLKNAEEQFQLPSNGVIGQLDFTNDVVIQSKTELSVMVDRIDLGPYQKKIVVTSVILEPSSTLSLDDIIKNHQ
ncbi:hypothetical protein [Chryseobacterium oryctis]|uniref:Uncharacterized protein n=1 Tax=Chryseobacterium oryctis TaxID=2952618 RepID=A0ABT3HPC9_9FLAO|nr:hypothetical protein [Chryseobacterium oryctis]MCW3161643.1 hypothetical protein [Chryseobacterium oryctis]